MVERCPVCEGKGLVPHDFYNKSCIVQVYPEVSCRSCKGAGYITIPCDDANSAAIEALFEICIASL